MLKISVADLARLEEEHPGIRETLDAIERTPLPRCSSCLSDDVARVHIGVVGRNIALAGATSKVRLLANKSGGGTYFCNACEHRYDEGNEQSAFEIVPSAAWSRHDMLSRLETGSNPDGDWHFILFALSDSEARAAKEIRLQYREDNGWKDAVQGASTFFPSRGWQQSSVDWFCAESGAGLEWRALIPKGNRA